MYDFSSIDSALSSLPAGQRFGFRVMANNYCYSGFSDGRDIPEYLTMTGKGWTAPVSASNCSSSQTQVYVPDWNDSGFLLGVQNLMKALGAKYNQDPRIAWVDIGIFGDWGEWHISEYPYCDSTYNTQQAWMATEASLQTIINAHVQAFPNKQLVISTTPYVTPDTNSPILMYALGLSPPIGLRKDSWGSTWWNTSWNLWAVTTGSITMGGSCPTSYSALAMSADQLNQIMSRWQTAPVAVESYGGSDSFQVGEQGLVAQIQDCHAACIENGSWEGPWSSISAGNQQGLIDSGLAAGYRLYPSSISVTQSSNTSLALSATWQNLGASPTYDTWKVAWSFVNPSDGLVLFSTTSSIDLRQVMPAWEYGSCTSGMTVPPTPTGAQTVVVDALSLPAHLSDNYQLQVKVTDANGYLLPMNLALSAAANADGSYNLGTLSLQ
jgi:hypothetical protein